MAITAKYDRATRRVVLEFTNGYLFAFPVRVIRPLDSATPAQLAAVELDPSGAALRWDALDVDVSVQGSGSAFDEVAIGFYAGT